MKQLLLFLLSFSLLAYDDQMKLMLVQTCGTIPGCNTVRVQLQSSVSTRETSVSPEQQRWEIAPKIGQQMVLIRARIDTPAHEVQHITTTFTFHPPQAVERADMPWEATIHKISLV